MVVAMVVMVVMVVMAVMVVMVVVMMVVSTLVYLRRAHPCPLNRFRLVGCVVGRSSVPTSAVSVCEGT